MGADRLVAMLIGAPPVGNTLRSDSEVTRTSAQEPIDTPNNLRTIPKTFAEENRPVTQPEPTPKSGVEHSILIKPDESP